MPTFEAVFHTFHQIFRVEIEIDIETLAVFIYGNVQGYSFRPPQKYRATKQALWFTSNLHETVSNSGCLACSELPNLLLKGMKV